MSKGVDYGFGQINGKILKTYGYTFVCRYLSNNPEKNLKLSEIQSFRNNNLNIVLVWETSIHRPLDGLDAGKQDAESALHLIKTLKLPANSPIYFACDDDFNLQQLVSIKEYFRGVIKVLGIERTGVYGGLLTVKTILDVKLCTYAWQTLAWSHGSWDPRVHIRQISTDNCKIGGVECDINISMKEDFGQC